MHAIDAGHAPLADRLWANIRRRGTGIVIALALEALLLLALLTLGQASEPPGQPTTAVTTFDVSAAPEPPTQEPVMEETPPPAQSATQRAAAPPAEPEAQPPAPVARQVPAPPAPAARPAPTILASPDPAPVPPPSAPARQPAPAPPSAKAGVVRGPMQGPAMGAADRGRLADSQVVGTAPNGQPLYAAAWYREPYRSEMAGYLSTATGPGWGLIACKTVADFRVEDCVALDEEPRGSNITRAALAAAWQFKVRPPRVGGRSLVGSWVRIRIDYGMGRASN